MSISVDKSVTSLIKVVALSTTERQGVRPSRRTSVSIALIKAWYSSSWIGDLSFKKVSLISFQLRKRWEKSPRVTSKSNFILSSTLMSKSLLSYLANHRTADGLVVSTQTLVKSGHRRASQPRGATLINVRRENDPETQREHKSLSNERAKPLASDETDVSLQGRGVITSD